MSEDKHVLGHQEVSDGLPKWHTIKPQAKKAEEMQTGPSKFAVVIMDDTPLPGLGVRSGPEWDALITNIAFMHDGLKGGTKPTILEKNPALRVLRNNNPFFEILGRHYATRGRMGIESTYIKFDKASVDIIEYCESGNTYEARTAIRDIGVVTQQLQGGQGMVALFQHVAALGELHRSRDYRHTVADIWQTIPGWLSIMPQSP